MNTKLTYIATVIQTEQIPQADRIHCATVDCGEGGVWKGVAQKEIQTGDKVIVFLQDAQLPQIEKYSFMKNNGWVVKIREFRGAPSDCLIMPCDIDGEVGDDVTELLGVVKYVKDIKDIKEPNAVGGFHRIVPKTDQPNFQSVQNMIEDLQGHDAVVTLKVDGTSRTLVVEDGVKHLYTRNLEVELKGDCWNFVSHWNIPSGFAVQFEWYGEGINKNPLGIKGKNAAVFDVYDIFNRRYLSAREMFKFCLGCYLPTVELLTIIPVFNYNEDDLRQLSKRAKYPNGKAGEGIVIRPYGKEMTSNFKRLSFKVINPLY